MSDLIMPSDFLFLCKQCKKELYGQVTFCPFCGLQFDSFRQPDHHPIGIAEETAIKKEAQLTAQTAALKPVIDTKDLKDGKGNIDDTSISDISVVKEPAKTADLTIPVVGEKQKTSASTLPKKHSKWPAIAAGVILTLVGLYSYATYNKITPPVGTITKVDQKILTDNDLSVSTTIMAEEPKQKQSQEESGSQLQQIDHQEKERLLQEEKERQIQENQQQEIRERELQERERLLKEMEQQSREKELAERERLLDEKEQQARARELQERRMQEEATERQLQEKREREVQEARERQLEEERAQQEVRDRQLQENRERELQANQLAKYLRAGKEYYKRNKFEDCIQAMEAVLGIDENNKDAKHYINMAQAQITKDKILKTVVKEVLPTFKNKRRK